MLAAPIRLYVTQPTSFRKLSNTPSRRETRRWRQEREEAPLDAQVAFAEEAGRQDRRRVRFILHFYRSTCFNLDFSVEGYLCGIHETPPARNSPQKKLKRKEYNTSTDFSKDVQLVFLNATEFNSEGNQIHGDVQTSKVCSFQAVSYVLWKAEPTTVVLLPSAHV